MTGAIIALVLGVLSFSGMVPIVIPVIGLALAANSLLRESKREAKRKPVMIVAWTAASISGLVTIIILL